MDDQRVINETDKSVDLTNHDQKSSESSMSLAMADESVIVDGGGEIEGSLRRSEKVKGVLEVNAEERSSCIVDVKLDDEDDGGCCNEGSFRRNEKAKGVLEENVDERSSSCVVDVKLDDEDDGGCCDEGSFRRNEKAKGVLEENVDERSTSFVVDLKLDDEDVGGCCDEGSFRRNEKAKGVLEENVVDGDELKDEKSSSYVVDVKLDDEDSSEGSFRHNEKAKGVLKEHVEDGGGELVCRICHLSSDQSSESSNENMKELSLIQLGCGCKDELGVAHSHCAMTWFKLKGNRICEICGEAARNITGIIREPRFMDEWNYQRSYGSGANYLAETSAGWWCGQPCCNLLMACLIVAVVLPWFFRINIF